MSERDLVPRYGVDALGRRYTRMVRRESDPVALSVRRAFAAPPAPAHAPGDGPVSRTARAASTAIAELANHGIEVADVTVEHRLGEGGGVADSGVAIVYRHEGERHTAVTYLEEDGTGRWAAVHHHVAVGPDPFEDGSFSGPVLSARTLADLPDVERGSFEDDGAESAHLDAVLRAADALRHLSIVMTRDQSWRLSDQAIAGLPDRVEAPSEMRGALEGGGLRVPARR